MLHSQATGPARGRTRRFFGRGSFCFTLAAYAGLWLPLWPPILSVRPPSHFATRIVTTRAMPQSASPYWLLVTFAGTNTPQSLSSFATSSFNGVAVQIDSAYYTGQTPALTTLESQFAQLHDAAQRDIWPWVFINRMVRSSGMDLSPAGNAQSQFLDDWRAALTLARATKSPGVILDSEFYNDPSIAYAMSRFSEALGLSAQEASQDLQHLGKTLADIAQQTYPAARIWILNSGLYTAQDEQIDGHSYYQPRGEISVGLLNELVALNSQVTIIDGGEDSLGYCHATLQGLQTQIALRQQQYAPALSEYGSRLSLSGTLTVWTAASNKTDWLTQGDCGLSEVWGIAGFTDYFALLDKTYGYNWLYGAQAGGYNPSDPTTATELTDAFQQAAAESQPPPPTPQPASPLAQPSALPASAPLRLAHRGGFAPNVRAPR